MNGARFVAAVGVVLAGLVAGAGVRAGEAVPGGYTRPQPVEPPGPLRVVTYYPETTTSKCIGDRRAPLCGVESAMAGWVRSRDYTRDGDYRSEEELAVLRSYTVEYKVIATRELDEAPGDVGVYLWSRDCYPVGCDPWNPSPMVHVVRKNANGHWGHPIKSYPVDTIFDRFAEGRPDQRFVDPAEPPGPLRIVTSDYEVSTSDCIKRPVTPLCAVETKMAHELNRSTWADYYNYKVAEIVRLDETNAPEWLLDRYAPLEPREYTGVVVWSQSCGSSRCENWPSWPHMYITRRDGERPNLWEVF